MAYYKIHVGNRTTVIRSEASLEEMGESYKDDLIGECDKFGNLRVPYISPEVSAMLEEEAREFWEERLNVVNHTKAEQFVRSCTVESPMFQQIFNDLITPSVSDLPKMVHITLPDGPSEDGWQELYIHEIKLFGLEKANERFVERGKELAQSVLTPAQKANLERLLNTTTLTERLEIERNVPYIPMEAYPMQHPTQEDYRAACRGERAWPIAGRPSLRSASNENIPVIKGVSLRDSNPVNVDDALVQILNATKGLPPKVRESIESFLREPALINEQAIKLITEEIVPLTERRYMRTVNYSHLNDLTHGYFTRHLDAYLEQNEKRVDPMRKASLEVIARDATKAAHSYVNKILEPQFLVQGFTRSFIFDNVEKDVMVISQSDYAGVRPIIKVTHDAGNFHLNHLLD